MNIWQFAKCIAYGKFQFSMPEDQPKSLVALAKHCLNIEPQHRPTFSEILELLSEMKSNPTESTDSIDSQSFSEISGYGDSSMVSILSN